MDNIFIAKALIIIFALFATSRVFFKYRREDITTKEFIIWALFWFVVVIATLWHKTTDIIAEFFGVGRGADLLVYISVIVLFFTVFKLIVKVEKIERDITKLARKMALEAREKKRGE